MVSSSLIGLLLFGESLSVAAVAGLLLIASGIFVLNSAQEG
jgi:multidrug transporter EmrE-like cation transporter